MSTTPTNPEPRIPDSLAGDLCTVYRSNVPVPGDIDLAGLHRHLAERLPGYARPLFLRLLPAIEVTSTFKHRKAELMREGFDPSAVADPLYIADARAETYAPLDAARFARIGDGAERL